MAKPGIYRQVRISQIGLQRLEIQLSRGAKIHPDVLTQWVKRYGDAARSLIQQHGQYNVVLDNIWRSSTKNVV